MGRRRRLHKKCRDSGKDSYTNRAAALWGGTHRHRLAEGNGFTTPELWVYRCFSCRRWHLTSKPQLFAADRVPRP